MHPRHFISALAAASVLALPTHAVVVGGAVTSGGGSFVLLPVPFTASTPDNTVGQDTFNTANLYAFNEDQNVLVTPANLNVDIVPGNVPGVVAAGTVVASHYVFFDPSNGAQEGYVDFDAAILAIITSTGNLLASDYLANTGVTYLNPGLRGLEAGDSALIDGTLPYRMNVDWTASSPGDYVRVLTAYSPGAVPDGGSSAVLLGLGALGLMGVSRRKA